jgi:hypothetical protein
MGGGGTDSESCAVADFGGNDVEASGFTGREFVSVFHLSLYQLQSLF